MSSSNFDPLNNRGNFKLSAARKHLDNLRHLEANSQGRSLASSGARLQAEMEIDEILYYMIGVKDALLQEINSELQLGLILKDVKLETVNEQLNQKRPEARDVTKEICNMVSNEGNPLWLVNELHNYSKHRAMIGMAIVFQVNDGVGDLNRPPLIDPRTGVPMRDDNGIAIPIIEYLAGSLTTIEVLQKTVREKIRKYRRP